MQILGGLSERKSRCEFFHMILAYRTLSAYIQPFGHSYILQK